MQRAVILFFLLAGCNVQPEAELAAFGDSVTWGYGDLPGGWVRRLEAKSGYSVTNLAVPGERADGAAGRIDGALRTAPNAKTVFVLHGGNDWILAWRGNWCKQSCEPAVVDNKYVHIGDHLRKIRATIARREKRTVFLTYWPDDPTKFPQYDAATFALYQRHRLRLNAEIERVAAENDDHVIHLDDLADFGSEGNFFDALHPSPQGYEKIAIRILADLASWVPDPPGPKDLLDFKPRL